LIQEANAVGMTDIVAQDCDPSNSSNAERRTRNAEHQTPNMKRGTRNTERETFSSPYPDNLPGTGIFHPRDDITGPGFSKLNANTQKQGYFVGNRVFL